jgi:hypothetical protein
VNTETVKLIMQGGYFFLLAYTLVQVFGLVRMFMGGIMTKLDELIKVLKRLVPNEIEDECDPGIGGSDRDPSRLSAPGRRAKIGRGRQE